MANNNTDNNTTAAARSIPVRIKGLDTDFSLYGVDCHVDLGGGCGTCTNFVPPADTSPTKDTDYTGGCKAA